jgi:hypothetical protein
MDSQDPSVILPDHTARVLRTLLPAAKTPDTDARSPRLLSITMLTRAVQGPTGVFKHRLAPESSVNGKVQAKRPENSFERIVGVSAFTFLWLPCLVVSVSSSLQTTSRRSESCHGHQPGDCIAVRVKCSCPRRMPCSCRCIGALWTSNRQIVTGEGGGDTRTNTRCHLQEWVPVRLGTSPRVDYRRRNVTQKRKKWFRR